ncbi:MAG: trehalase family glycosidase [Candidatus Hodarchaeota archaeon]
MKICEYLQRHDKWYLGDGKALVFAPPFPIWLDTPGFWDEAHYCDQLIETPFTITILDSDLSLISLERQRPRIWQPNALISYYTQVGSAIKPIEVKELRVILEPSILCSSLNIKGLNPNQQIHIIVWTAPQSTNLKAVQKEGDFVILKRYLKTQNNTKEKVINQVLFADAPLVSFSSQLSRISKNHPRWDFTPFVEQIAMDKVLNNEIFFDVGVSYGGVYYGGAQYTGIHYKLQASDNGEVSILIGSAFHLSLSEGINTILQLKSRLDLLPSLFQITEGEWEKFFQQVPHFSCSDPYFEKYYWYRWFGLRLSMINVKTENHPYPCVYEGIGYFRKHISYSAQCHMVETRWMHDPSFAQGSLLGFGHTFPETGRMPGRVGLLESEDMHYLMNIGWTVRAVNAVHPDPTFLSKAHPLLENYLQYLDATRKLEGKNIYCVFDIMETGQEFNQRYQFANKNADKGESFRLGAVDLSIYTYELQKALAQIAESLGKTEKSRELIHEAEKTRKAILATLWDPNDQMFYDVNLQGQHSKVKAGTCFYPFMTDIVTKDHLPAIRKYLINKEEFWTDFPIPSVSQSDSAFDPVARWKGKRMLCPWSGRVWPMLNSHICEVLVRAGSLDKSLISYAVIMIRKFIHMMFFNQDVTHPNSFEHYNPLTGYPSIYRGIDDYQHSWVVDLIIKYVCGLRPRNDNILQIEPLNFGLSHFTLDRLYYRKHWIRVVWRQQKIDEEDFGLTVYLDNQKVAFSPTFGKIEIELN